MANVHDVAAYILQQTGRVTTMKLQKLVYYSQGWSLVWDGAPLFDSRLEAWGKGPVVPELYERHRGDFYVDAWTGNAASLTAAQKKTVDAVVEYFGKFDGEELSELTHRDVPWIRANKGRQHCDETITLDAMRAHYKPGALKEKRIGADLDRGYRYLLALSEEEARSLYDDRPVTEDEAAQLERELFGP